MEKKVIQITSGRGPRECEWVVAKTLAFFLVQSKKKGVKTRIVDQQAGRTSQEVLSVTVELTGENVGDIIGPWLGSIQWIGQSPFRKNHKRKNWFIGFFEVKKQKLIEFNEKEVKYQSMRSSGSGGQHVNKVSSAVRAIHLPTGIQAVSMDSRSQLQNKKTALLRLKEKLSGINLEKNKDAVIDKWSNHLELERGNPVMVFVGERFKLKKSSGLRTRRASRVSAPR
ncbi:MAG: peptide chain release factor H [Crocinitomicaceae bacterium]|nr:peptide chain release factor H [Crocinitomicaceae bacterium]